MTNSANKLPRPCGEHRHATPDQTERSRRKAHYEQLIASGLYELLTDRGMLVEHEEEVQRDADDVALPGGQSDRSRRQVTGSSARLSVRGDERGHVSLHFLGRVVEAFLVKCELSDAGELVGLQRRHRVLANLEHAALDVLLGAPGREEESRRGLPAQDEVHLHRVHV